MLFWSRESKKTIFSISRKFLRKNPENQKSQFFRKSQFFGSRQPLYVETDFPFYGFLRRQLPIGAPKTGEACRQPATSLRRNGFSVLRFSTKTVAHRGAKDWGADLCAQEVRTELMGLPTAALE